MTRRALWALWMIVQLIFAVPCLFVWGGAVMVYVGCKEWHTDFMERTR